MEGQVLYCLGEKRPEIWVWLYNRKGSCLRHEGAEATLAWHFKAALPLTAPPPLSPPFRLPHAPLTSVKVISWWGGGGGVTGLLIGPVRKPVRQNDGAQFYSFKQLTDFCCCQLFKKYLNTQILSYISGHYSLKRDLYGVQQTLCNYWLVSRCSRLNYSNSPSKL